MSIHPDDQVALDELEAKYPSQWLKLALKVAYKLGRIRVLKELQAKLEED